MSGAQDPGVVVTPAEAAALVPAGARIGLGGLQGNHPMATIRALARRGTALSLVAGPPVGMAGELLIAAGLVATIAAPYMGDPAVPVAPAYQRAVERGATRVWECDEAILLTALRAAGQGLPFLPWRGGRGTSLPELNPDLTEMVDERSGQHLLRIEAMPLDVAIVRALEADRLGNVRYFRHSFYADLTFARAASTVIVEVERLVSHDQVLADPGATVHHRVDAVVVAPSGGHPFPVPGVQRQDDPWLREWAAGIRAADRDADLREVEVVRRELGCATHDDYLDLVGRDRVAALRIPGRDRG